jgi:hypothetical protein
MLHRKVVFAKTNKNERNNMHHFRPYAINSTALFIPTIELHDRYDIIQLLILNRCPHHKLRIMLFTYSLMLLYLRRIIIFIKKKKS